MARLPDYTVLGDGPSPLRGRGAGIVRADLSAPAQAAARLGQTVAAVGGMIGDRVEEQRNKAEQFNTQRRFLEFSAAQEEALGQASQTVAPGAFGFREQYAKTYQQQAKEFFKTVPDELKPDYDAKLFQIEDQLAGKALTFERQARSTYYSNAVADGLTKVENSLYSAPDQYERHLSEGMAFIDAIPDDDVSPIAKEQLRREWKEKARLAALSGMSPAARETALGQGPSVDVGQVGSGVEGAKAILRKKEGFRDTPYWDVNADRIGYGSDTITRADGTVERVTKGSRVSKEDAERDLDRRVREFERTVVGQVGAREWGAMPASAQAALISVAYNYGRLPANVANAVKSGDVQAVASAVEARASDNDGINARRRREEASVIRGTGSIEAQAAGQVDPRFEDMDYVTRQKVLDGAAAEIARQATAERAEATAAYTIHKDAFSLGIETGEIVSEQTIIADNLLNDGDKATLLKALRTRQGDTLATQEAIRQFSEGGLAVDPYSSDGKKLVDGVWGEVSQIVGPERVQPTLEELVRQTGSVPQQAVNQMRLGLTSSNVAEVAAAAQSAQRVSTLDSAALSRRDGGSDVQRFADDFSFYVDRLNMSPEDAARRIIDAQSQTAQRDRKALEPVAKDFRKELEAADLGAMFDDSIMGWRSNPAVGFTPQMQAGIMLDFLDIAEDEFYRSGGNPDIARNRATEQMKRLYGVTSLTGSPTVMKYPPEQYWPAFRIQKYGNTSVVSGEPSLDYARIQLEESLRAVDPTVSMDNVVLLTTPQTDAEIKRGEIPGYAVMYLDENGVYQTPFPGQHFRPDVQAAQEREAPVFDRRQQEREERARERNETLRQRTEDRTRVEKAGDAAATGALEDAVGPDWMRARAAEAARELAIEEDARAQRNNR
jgi:GH24 family phage-related lysozyme (muramidase)